MKLLELFGISYHGMKLLELFGISYHG
jgi:hypothetical protein